MVIVYVLITVSDVVISHIQYNNNSIPCLLCYAVILTIPKYIKKNVEKERPTTISSTLIINGGTALT